MHIYTRDELAELLGIQENEFDRVVTRTGHWVGSEQALKLKMPIDIGERRPAAYLVRIDERGWSLHPTLASARLWNRERDQWVTS